MKTEGKLEIRPVEGANGPALLVSGTLTLDGVAWEVSAWLHRWSDGQFHVGLENDAPLFALHHALSASRVHWSKVDWESSTAVRRKLAAMIEAEVNAQAQAADCPTDNYLTTAIKHGFVKRERRGSHLYFVHASSNFFEITPDHGWVLYFGPDKLKISGSSPEQLTTALSKIPNEKGDSMKKPKKQTQDKSQEAPIIERTAAVSAPATRARAIPPVRTARTAASSASATPERAPHRETAR